MLTFIKRKRYETVKHLQQVVDIVRFTACKLASVQETVLGSQSYVG